jgi:hypothetical protein
MARIRLIAVCAVVALALAVVGVSSASAAEVGECLKLAKVELKYHGKYVDKNCRVPATPTEEAEGKHNKWEWSPGVTPEHAPFTAKTKFGVRLEIDGTIVCRTGLTAGEWTGPKTATETTTFEGCETQPYESEGNCQSAGQAAGTIVTNALEITVLGEGESSPEFTNEYKPKVVGPGEIWKQLRGPGNELTSISMEFECSRGLAVLKTEGSVAGVIPPAAFPNPGSVNRMSKKSEVRFEPEKGAQGWSIEANILGKGFIPAGPGGLTMRQLVRNTGKIEIRE